jgi:hypothetical protein
VWHVRAGLSARAGRAAQPARASSCAPPAARRARPLARLCAARRAERRPHGDAGFAMHVLAAFRRLPTPPSAAVSRRARAARGEVAIPECRAGTSAAGRSRVTVESASESRLSTKQLKLQRTTHATGRGRCSRCWAAVQHSARGRGPWVSGGHRAGPGHLCRPVGGPDQGDFKRVISMAVVLPESCERTVIMRSELLVAAPCRE